MNHDFESKGEIISDFRVIRINKLNCGSQILLLLKMVIVFGFLLI